MQEDKFLEDYKQVWQQDNEEMTRIVDIPLETLHKNIARYERRKRSRRIVWTTLSAAACLAFAVTTGLHYLTPSTTTDSPVLVAENRVERHTPRLTAYPSREGMRCTRPKVYHSVDDDGSRDVSPLDFLNPLQRGTPKAGGMPLSILNLISSQFNKFSTLNSISF